jgi:integrase
MGKQVIELRRKVLLPVLRLTQLCDTSEPGAIKRAIKASKGHESLTYYHRNAVDEHGKTSGNYNLFPVILDSAGKPWLLAAYFLLDKLEGQSRPNMKTYWSLADDLGAFREWLDQCANPEEMLFHFPSVKQQRVTYRYNGFLKAQISGQEVIKASTAKRRMATVTAFYRWLIDEKLFEPENSPWIDRSVRLSFKGRTGAVITKNAVTTDITIRVAKSEVALDDTIQDGGKLRPLSGQEQSWLMEALKSIGNLEMSLISLFMIATGARIQTATTLRVSHFTRELPAFPAAVSGGGTVHNLRCGPGTGIDTKGDVNKVLQIPEPVYLVLHKYALSARAQRRRLAAGNDSGDQYLFLTQQGNPYYTAKDESLEFDPDLSSRNTHEGGTIRKFFTQQVIPYIRKHHQSTFHMRPHDLRATFGMNHTDIQNRLVDTGKTTRTKARNIVRQLMWHVSGETTDLYLDYRERLEQVTSAINHYGEQIQAWTDMAMEGSDYD